MTKHNIIAIGASAGGVETLSNLVSQLPSDLDAAIFVAIHFPPRATSVLPQILNRLKTLPAQHPAEGDAIAPGQIYIAPPDHHLFVRQGHIHLDHGARENGHRPAIDTLFRSIAYAYGRQAIGVILTGTLDDGTAGLLTIKARGGIAIVQDPNEALFAGMPLSAINAVEVDEILRVRDIAKRLIELSLTPIHEQKPMTDEISHEGEWVAQEKAAIEQGERTGLASTFTCPDCGGVLWELHDQNLMRYRCHVGHAYSIDSLLSEKDNSLERALWTAHRALEEKAALARRMAAQAKRSNYSMSEAQFLERAAEAENHAAVLKQVLSQQIELQPHPEEID
ncbi:chemotaxis protein CheB [Leptolyngbya boryana NIES-2135]|jgi:two-component system chemotaxis response regulator CheB|uniref:protein-glutamate methylesterase n=1 Tax=Leptolyngbya boryana NIES-2135 TaxID=1973484 RepID=A0A1Z4JL61_LEPBY|nr:MULTISPECIES: chemotaxis protein CheB [Leptolyngbya]BAY57499.1 chemotaxis protein CheB [Leptolyngbya boryana NIES-2135]MBD2368564.1 chemotaxis protein CheB [Leptolyngbya sp. FACHB-161]MBD2375175.1 chemotaxis protein CheB [Leptolyngbya sp. FACHB-238]MBD2399594.1 chemotaxis protein CheB [Leptolyngbya sp. FACHB-239]MBD2405799.1 chemotaxis protein CheB [Leptolyngbya sp. FACHB-402]